ncbi:GNAT family N-acetyltransferase [Paenibacillus eucommiae]|uniref:GNAT superfamily N-acetyltransferase n=1 Tax=Paenibacillus eucommiae TaxID=1355755 RepID=A0ABS4ISJ6_9BACL|nr:GNAT family N-acetyltransferase [Paenibacillus eucommiae]MBP1989986.1 GNAT superfamily N-acetyltransferase [Paenibacillus eucommiae]
MYRWIKLTPDDWPRYRGLMFGHLMPRLPELEAEGRLSVFGVELVPGSQDESCTPIGLVIAEQERVERETRAAHILSLFVHRGYRRAGLGSRLMSTLEQHLASQGVERLRFVYYSGKEITPALEAFISRSGWSAPSLEAKIYHIDKQIVHAPWLREHPLPAGIQAFPWGNLSQLNKARLLEQEGEMYPAFLSPFKSFAPLEAANSLGLETDGDIVGWIVNYRISEDTVLYDAVFITPKYQLSGLALLLLCRSILIQLETGIPYAMFTVNMSTPFMLSIAERRLRPYAKKVSEKRVVYKSINGCERG